MPYLAMFVLILVAGLLATCTTTPPAGRSRMLRGVPHLDPQLLARLARSR